MRTILFAICLLTCLYADVTAGQRYARNSGNWNANIWSTTNGGTVGAATPGANDTVYISVGTGTHSITVPANYSAACALVVMGEATNSRDATLTLAASTSSLSVGGSLSIYGPSGNVDRTLNVGDGILTVGGNLTLGKDQSNPASSRRCSLYVNKGIVTIGGNLILETVSNGASDQNYITLNDTATFNLAGDFTIVSGKGSLDPGTASTFNFNGTSPQTITFAGSISYYNVNINNTAGVTVTQAVGTGNIAGDFRVLSGTFDNGGYAIVGSSSKAFQVADSATFIARGTTSMVTGFGTKTFAATSTVDYAGGNQTVSNESYGHLKLSSSGGTAVTKTMPSGSLSTAGNLTSSATGTGTTVTFSALGSMTIGGNVWIGASTTCNGGSYTHTVRGNWTNDGTFNGNTGTISLAGTTSQTIAGGSTTTFYNLTIANTSAVIYGTQNFNVSSTMSVNTNAIFSPSAGVSINNSASQGTLTGGGTVRVTRISSPANFTTQYRFNTNSLNNLQLDYIGTAPQYVNVTSAGRLRVANVNNVMLSNSMSVLTQLIMESGNIFTGSDTLTLGQASWSPGTLSRTSGLIVGTFRRWFNSVMASNVEFPLGHANLYRGISLSYTTAPTNGGTLTTKFYVVNPGTNGLPKIESGYQIQKTLTDGYWKISAGNGLAGGTYSLALSATGFGGIDSVGALRVLKRPDSSSNWSLNGTHQAGTGTASAPVAYRTGLTGFSDFAIGAYGESTLPVELVSFTGTLQDTRVALAWRTASETQNEGFDIERGVVENNGDISWQRVGFTAGHGTTSEPQRYSWYDPVYDLRHPGESVMLGYRLRQVDYDGTATYSHIVLVELGDPSVRPRLNSLAPNPFRASTNIEYRVTRSARVHLEICDVLGNTVNTLIDNEQDPGIYSQRFDATALPPGSYYCRLTIGSYTAIRPMVLLRE